MLPYGRQSIDEEDMAAVASVLRSDFLTAGPKVEEFERRFAEMAGAKHAVAVNSATSALHLAMRVANIGPGDRVITSPNTFVASANSAAFVGAIPDFADIDPISFNLDPASLEAAWLPDTKAVVAVDYAGQSCDMPAISQVARSHGAIIIEDAAHATGGRFEHAGKQWKVGAHPWADMSIFSFHPVKTMTTGEGGMLVTDNDQWALTARQLRSHGVIREDFAGLGAEDDPDLAERGPWYYEMNSLGYNYRITDIQCALGISQLSRLDQFISRRREIVASYNEALAGIPCLTMPGLRNPADRDLTSWHLYTVQIDFRAINKTRTQVMSDLRKQGIITQVLYIPVYLQPWYRRTYNYKPGKCPNAENYYGHALSLPLFPAMTRDDIEHVINALKQVIAS
jgi:UDP-4-amino-4,6-dideoxy-N-acetyl-beta-L-altrosamine transaminase